MVGEGVVEEYDGGEFAGAAGKSQGVEVRLREGAGFLESRRHTRPRSPGLSTVTLPARHAPCPRASVRRWARLSVY